MLKLLKNLFRAKSEDDEIGATEVLRRTGEHRVTKNPQSQPVQRPKSDYVEPGDDFSGTIEENGPGKNVLVKSRYVREETGTYETLKILDDSIIDSGEEEGIDPYNTGDFDRSKNWEKRFRK